MEEAQPAPVVSVLIVSYNCAGALRRCLEALERSASRETLEILVVDNGSQDESGRLDTDFPNTTFLRLPRNFGLTKARNIGIRTAKGKFLLLLEADAEVEPETVSALAALLATDSEAVAVCPLLVDRDGRPRSRGLRLPTPESLYRVWKNGDFNEALDLDLQAESIPVELADQTAFLVRRQFVKGMNYFDERYGQFGGELELCFQIARASKKMLLIPGIRVASGGGLWETRDSAVRAVFSADCAVGVVAYASKRFGWTAGLKLRLKILLRALGGALVAVVRARDVGYHFNRLSLLVSGQKIDGSQQAL